MTVLQLADVPDHNNPRSPEERDPEEKNKDQLGGNHTGLQVKTGVPNKGPKQEEVKTEKGAPVGLAVGVTIGAGIVIAIVIFLVWRHRKRSNAESVRKTGHGSDTNLAMRVTVDMNAAKDVDSIKMQIRRPSDKPPEVPPHRNLVAKAKSPLEVRRHQGPAATSTPKSPKQSRLSEEVPPTAVSCISNNPNSVQKQAWDSMLQTAATMVENEEEQGPRVSETTPMMENDLPPPPDFLLENDQNEAAQDDAGSYQDILDGYHSEDNVDEDSGYIDISSRGHHHARGSS